MFNHYLLRTQNLDCERLYRMVGFFKEKAAKMDLPFKDIDSVSTPVNIERWRSDLKCYQENSRYIEIKRYNKLHMLILWLNIGNIKIFAKQGVTEKNPST